MDGRVGSSGFMIKLQIFFKELKIVNLFCLTIWIFGLEWNI